MIDTKMASDKATITKKPIELDIEFGSEKLSINNPATIW